MAVITVENLTHTYSVGTPFEQTAIRDVSVTLTQGESIFVLGHTGSGKSTFVQHLNALLQPTRGQVKIDGEDINKDKISRRDVKRRVGLVFQYPEYQLFEETVAADIAFGPKNMKLSEDEIDKKVTEAARFTGLRPELLDKSPFDLSGGEKRRAAIAGVIAMDPDVLILDEPAAGLDPLGRDALLSQIKDYHDTRKNTVLLVSHSMEDIARISDRILVMNKGKNVMLDSAKAVFSRGRELEAMGLRVPQITRIMMLLREKGIPVDTGALTVEQGFSEVLGCLSQKHAAVKDQ